MLRSLCNIIWPEFGSKTEGLDVALQTPVVFVVFGRPSPDVNKEHYHPSEGMRGSLYLAFSQV